MSFSLSTGVVDLDEFPDVTNAVQVVVDQKVSEIPEGNGKNEAIVLREGIVEAAVSAAQLVRGDGRYVSFSISGHGTLLDEEFNYVSLNVSATRATAPESEPSAE